MEKPKWGTCGTCRWYRLDEVESDSRGGPVVVCLRYSPVVETTVFHTCGEWEPPEGRVCGNCEKWMGFQDTIGRRHYPTGGGSCDANGDPRADKMKLTYHTCPAWRWRGSESSCE